jgi:hypothetical protein
MRQVHREVHNEMRSIIDEIVSSERLTLYEVNLHIDESVNIAVYNNTPKDLITDRDLERLT